MSAVVRCKFRPRRRVSGSTAVGDAHVATEQPVSRCARMLALAHHIERLIEAGELDSVASASRALSLTRARLTQVMNLLLLAPAIQERLLAGELRQSEPAMRRVVREATWTEQDELIPNPEVHL